MIPYHETANYRLVEDSHGFFTLTRKRDNVTAFFQGDDAALWSRNMNLLFRINFDIQHNSLDQSFDFLCEGYDDVMS